MTRIRSDKNAALPMFLYLCKRSDGVIYYAYMRPDNKKRFTLGKNAIEATDLALTLNRLFSVDELSSMGKLAKTLYRKRAIQNASVLSNEIPEKIKCLLPDLFPRSQTAYLREKTDVQEWIIKHSKRDEYKEPADWNRSGETLATLSWVQSMYRTCKRNAVKRKIIFAIGIEDVVALIKRSKGRCGVSGVRLYLDSNGGKRRPFAPSIDRIDCTQGYTPTNIRIVCVAVNLAMNEWGEDVLYKIALGIFQQELVDNFG